MSRHAGRKLKVACCSPVQEAARARKDSFTSSNPLSLGGGGLTPRGANMKTPLGWITEKLTGVGAR
jgi:AP-3 complex subunit sigma